MRYMVLMKQDGEGCDYSIGCGMTFEEFRADDDAKALDKVKTRLEDYGATDMEKVILLRIDEGCEISVPFKKWQEDADAALEAEEDAEELRKAEETAARLRAKLVKKT